MKPTRISTQRAELSALRVIGRALGSGWDVATTLQTISQTTANVMRMDSCSIYLLDKDERTLILKASTGLVGIGQAKLRLGEGITGYAAQSGKPIAVRDAANDARFKYLPETQEQDFKSLLAVPLVSQGKIIGAMNMQTRVFHRYTQPEIELASLIGDLAAGALARAVQHDELQRQVQELAALSQISNTITAPMYLDDMLKVIVEMAAKIMRAKATALLLFDEESSELRWRASFGLSREHLERSRVHVENSLTGRVVTSGEFVAVRDVQADARYSDRERAKEEGFSSFLSVPLKFRDKIIGAFNCYLGATHDFTVSEIQFFSTLANQTALALENANLAMSALLIREMHHRIKNNLQMIAMLLRLQLREGPEQYAREVLPQTITRVLSIAAVHEALSREGLRVIGLKALIEQAARLAMQNMIRPTQEIRVLIEGDEIELPSQTATSLALVANELLQNAIEHGYGEDAHGTVCVRLAQAANEIELQVTDDGMGLPKEGSVDKSLGLEIVRTLVTEDLLGEFELTPKPSGQGTRAVVRVPIRQA